jgi:hypothetical protein
VRPPAPLAGHDLVRLSQENNLSKSRT